MVLGHFKEIKVHIHNLSVKVRKGKMTFYKSECPAYNVRWPLEGTFQLDIIQEVHRKVFAHWMGHPNHVLYIVIWEDLVTDPSPWVKSFLPTEPRLSVLAIIECSQRQRPGQNQAAIKPSDPSYPILQDRMNKTSFPPSLSSHLLAGTGSYHRRRSHDGILGPRCRPSPPQRS